MGSGTGRRALPRAPSRLVLEIDIGQRLPAGVADGETGVGFLDGPGRREAACGRHRRCRRLRSRQAVDLNVTMPGQMAPTEDATTVGGKAGTTIAGRRSMAGAAYSVSMIVLMVRLTRSKATEPVVDTAAIDARGGASGASP